MTEALIHHECGTAEQRLAYFNDCSCLEQLPTQVPLNMSLALEMTDHSHPDVADDVALPEFLDNSTLPIADEAFLESLGDSWKDDTLRQFEAILDEENVRNERALHNEIEVLLPRMQDRGRTRYLAAACGRGNTMVMTFLLEHGAHIDSSIIAKAVARSDIKALNLFVTYGWDINSAMTDQQPPALSLAIHDQTLVEWFLAKGARPGERCELLNYTPLSSAVREASMPVVLLMLETDGRLERGELLHHAVKRTLQDYMDLLEELLKRGAQVNRIMYEDDPVAYEYQRLLGLGTPLHSAAITGRVGVVNLLLRHGADPSIRDSRGELPETVAGWWNHNEASNVLRAARMTDTKIYSTR